MPIDQHTTGLTNDASFVYRSRRGIGGSRQPAEKIQRADRWEIVFPAHLSDADYARFLDDHVSAYTARAAVHFPLAQSTASWSRTLSRIAVK